MSESFNDYRQMRYLYCLDVRIDGRKRIKIGITDNIEKRIYAIERELEKEGYSCYCYRKPRAVIKYPRDDIGRIESNMHNKLYDDGVDIEKRDGTNFTEYYPERKLKYSRVQRILRKSFKTPII